MQERDAHLPQDAQSYPAGWWLIPSATMGSGFWVWLIYTLIMR